MNGTEVAFYVPLRIYSVQHFCLFAANVSKAYSRTLDTICCIVFSSSNVHF